MFGFNTSAATACVSMSAAAKRAASHRPSSARSRNRSQMALLRSCFLVRNVKLLRKTLETPVTFAEPERSGKIEGAEAYPFL